MSTGTLTRLTQVGDDKGSDGLHAPEVEEEGEKSSTAVTVC